MKHFDWSESGALAVAEKILCIIINMLQCAILNQLWTLLWCVEL